jgi:hypothetical protein
MDVNAAPIRAAKLNFNVSIFPPKVGWKVRQSRWRNSLIAG